MTQIVFGGNFPFLKIFGKSCCLSTMNFSMSCEWTKYVVNLATSSNVMPSPEREGRSVLKVGHKQYIHAYGELSTGFFFTALQE